MDFMPWWGWLIAGCVVFVVCAWLLVALAMARVFRKESREFDRHWDQMHRPYGRR